MLSTQGLRTFLRCVRHLGLGQALKLRQKGQKGEEICVTPKGYQHPIWLRRHTTDAWVLIMVVLSEEYSLIPADFTAKRIVDAGANAGYGALYFLKRWPNAEIISIEPDPENYALACKNLKNYPNVKVVNGAMMGEDGKVDIVSHGEWKYANQVAVSKEGEVPAYSMDSILEMAGWDACDLVKIDIEGSELNVFSSDKLEWLNRVRGIVVELHEDTAPGCTSALFDAMRGHPFTLGYRGENLFIRLKEAVVEKA